MYPVVFQRPITQPLAPVSHHTLQPIVLNQLAHTRHRLRDSWLKDHLERQRVRVRRMRERKVVNGGFCVGFNRERPLDECGVHKHRSTKGRVNIGAMRCQAGGTHAVAICCPGHTRRPKPNEKRRWSSRRVPFSVIHRCGLNFSGSGKYSGSRPIALRSSITTVSTWCQMGESMKTYQGLPMTSEPAGIRYPRQIISFVALCAKPAVVGRSNEHV